mgnify:CR=1 FL=1
MKQSKYNAVIVGSGIAGLYAALKLEQNCSGLKILLVTKSTLNESNSYYAQGGMVAVLKDNKNDSVESHIKDTLVAGAGLNDEQVVRFISENSDEAVKDLLKFGVKFDCDNNGNFTLTKEAAHSVRRILHSGGDATGREMEIALVKAVKSNNNIEIRENTAVVDLIVENNICKGLISFDNNGYEQINSDVVILATGGLGQIYKYTTNPQCATGDGFALAYRAGAKLRDMEFVQFHPTALAIDDIEHKNRFLISEAVRGEGAKLCDKNGFEYMINYDERKELAPRDIVARANFTQMQKNNEPNVYLNATVIGKEKLLKRFPTIAKKCAQYGIDITKDYIPVSPVAHYFMGGVKTDLNGETSVKNLYAIGETASTGLHGANRLASNSLLECVVCAYKTAQYLKDKKLLSSHYSLPAPIQNDDSHSLKISTDMLQTLKQKLKSTMWQNVGIFRDENSLLTALDDINEIEKEFNKPDYCSSIEEYELRNMIITSKLVVKSALSRKESRGAHYRTDYLLTDVYANHSEV